MATDHTQQGEKLRRFTPLSGISILSLLLRITAAAILLVSTSAGYAQATATASRFGDAQVGGGYINGSSDYARSRLDGYNFYADLDFRHNFGAEIEYNYMTDADAYTAVYQRTYEIGARYSRHYGRYQPYAKVMIGRGVQNYPFNAANLAYNIGAIGAGADIRLRRHINARVQYEYQRWFSFRRDAFSAPNDSVTPSLLSVGFAYHF